MKYKHLAMLMGVMITATSVGSTATAFAKHLTRKQTTAKKKQTKMKFSEK